MKHKEKIEKKKICVQIKLEISLIVMSLLTLSHEIRISINYEGYDSETLW